MVPSELESFIGKYRQLWNNGYTAHLDVGTHAGKAWVGLRVQLDGRLHTGPSDTGTSRERRRARRAAARAANHCPSPNREQDTHKEVAETGNSGILEDEKNEVGSNQEVITEEVENYVAPAEKVVEVVHENETEEVEDNASKILEQDEIADIPPTPTSVTENVIVSSIQAKVPDKIRVYCTATIDNCPDDIINSEYGDSIRRFLQSEHHLKDNVTIQ